jgi:hypothetical protein
VSDRHGRVVVCELPPSRGSANGCLTEQEMTMKRRSNQLVSGLVAAIALATATACGDANFQAVNMDQAGERGGPAGSVHGAAGDRYRDAAMGAVGTSADPVVVQGDGREQSDTVYSPEASPQPADTTPRQEVGG